jgi:hypothetical protein
VSDRFPCINLSCRRTARAEYEPGEEIICRNCWRKLPERLRADYQRLNRRERRMLRLVERRVQARTIPLARIIQLQQRMEARRLKLWEAIRLYFNEPAAPVGLETFLKEVGL